MASQLKESQVAIVGADLRDEAQVQQLFAAAEARFGAVDVLVANAGVWPVPHTPLKDMPLAQWRETLDHNLTSVFLSVREFLQRSTAHGKRDPATVVIGSTAGFFGEAGHGDYAAAKSGLMNGMLMSLKNEMVEFAPQGRVNAVCPGWTLTDMARDLTKNPEAMKKALQTVPLKKFGKPADVAAAVLFFSSNRLAGHITGQQLFVSGGMEGRVLAETLEIDLDAAQ